MSSRDRTEYFKKWHEKNKEKRLAQQKDYYRNNKEKIKKYAKEYNLKNREKIKLRTKLWYEKNKEEILKKDRERKRLNPEKRRIREKNNYHNNLNYRLKKIVMRRLNHALNDNQKISNTLGLLGVNDLEILISHLKSKFKKGMSFDNYGEWHIDHIIPCASFDLTKESEQKKCFHYTNLQPLWAKDNFSKGCRLNWKGGNNARH